MSHFNALITEAERARFAAACRRHGFVPAQFRLVGDDFCKAIDGAGEMTREVVVTHQFSARPRRYLRGQFADWIAAFENDLLAGAFNDHTHGW